MGIRGARLNEAKTVSHRRPPQRQRATVILHSIGTLCVGGGDVCNPPSASLGGIVEGRRMKEPLRSSRLARRALALLLAAASTVSPASTCLSDKPKCCRVRS